MHPAAFMRGLFPPPSVGRVREGVAAFAVTLCLSISALAEEVRTISWEELVPAREALADTLAEVPMSVRFDLGFAAKVFSDAEAGVISQDSPEVMIAKDVLARLSAQGLDAERLLQAFTERDQAIGDRSRAVNAGLDGRTVRLPGYALPLSVSETGVREFLLVPYVGACIHYPPPPPNQIVRASLDEPHTFEDRYQTVWITGRLSARPTSRALDYVDGQATVETSYTMQVSSVIPFAEDPSAPTTLGSFSSIAKAPTLQLSRSGRPHKVPTK